jgi:putative signal transducing protein
MLVVIASAQNEPEAQMICARLAGAGIDAVYKRGIGADLPQLGGSGNREVFVDERSATRARELLAVPEFSDEELAELSERAADGLPGDSPA